VVRTPCGTAPRSAIRHHNPHTTLCNPYPSYLQCRFTLCAICRTYMCAAPPQVFLMPKCWIDSLSLLSLSSMALPKTNKRGQIQEQPGGCRQDRSLRCAIFRSISMGRSGPWHTAQLAQRLLEHSAQPGIAFSLLCGLFSARSFRARCGTAVSTNQPDRW